MIFEKNVKIDFDIEKFIKAFIDEYNYNYDYSKENIKNILIEYIADLKQNENSNYNLFDDEDIEKILNEVIEKIQNKKLSDEQIAELKADLKRYKNIIKLHQKKIEYLEKILKENE